MGRARLRLPRLLPVLNLLPRLLNLLPQTPNPKPQTLTPKPLQVLSNASKTITTDYYYRLLLQTITTDYYYRLLLSLLRTLTGSIQRVADDGLTGATAGTRSQKSLFHAFMQ